MSILEWEEPPSGRERYDWPSIVKACKERPGEWALVARDVAASNTSSAKRHGLQARTSAVGRNYMGSHADLYVRWPAGGAS